MTEQTRHERHIVAEQDAKRPSSAAHPSSAARASGTIVLDEAPETMARGGGVVGVGVLE